MTDYSFLFMWLYNDISLGILREVPLEIRHDRELRDTSSVDTKGIMESIKVKMLMQGTDEMPSSVKVYI
jgi:hypothetical protein